MAKEEPISPIADRVRALVPELERRLPGLELVYLFGSHALDRAHPGSDVDLAVLARAPLPELLRFELVAELSRALAAEVDLVDLAAASTVMRKEVVAGGQVVLSRDPGARAAFEGRVLSDYARLNEERRPVLERIAREGTVHGR